MSERAICWIQLAGCAAAFVLAALNGELAFALLMLTGCVVALLWLNGRLER